MLLLKNPGYMELRHIENIGAKGISMSNKKAKMAIKQLATASPNGFLQSPSHLRRVILSKLKDKNYIYVIIYTIIYVFFS